MLNAILFAKKAPNGKCQTQIFREEFSFNDFGNYLFKIKKELRKKYKTC